MNQDKKVITLKDVAKLAGVSTATASLALSGDARVNIKTKQKVKEVASKLNYIPNEIGRSLRVNKTDTIALVFPSSANNAFNHPYFINLVEGIMTELTKKGYHLMLSTTMNDSEEYTSYEKILRNKRADGIILWPSNVQDKNILKILESNIPFVYLNKWHFDDVLSVTRDEEQGAYMITQHLLNSGRSNIVHLTGDINLQVSIDRLEGYKQALSDKQLLYKKENVINGDFTKDFGAHAVEQLIKKGIKFDAIYAANDMMAIGAMEALKQLGMRVPQDVSVAGYDNIEMASYVDPPITTAYHSLKEQGKIAAETIIHAVEGKEIKQRQVVLPAKMIIRESTTAF